MSEEGQVAMTAPAGEKFERKLDARLVASIFATGIMTFSGMIIETSMNVSFPALMGEFGVGTSVVQWLTTIYVLVVACIIPTSAFLSKRFRTRPLFLVAITLYSLGLLISIMAPTFWFLLLGRVFEGMGTGLALPLMYNIIVEQTPFEYMGMVMGIGTFVPACAPALGPPVGGLIAENFGWRMVFMIMLPIVVACAILGAVNIRQSHETSRERFDVAGWLNLVVAIVTLVLGLGLTGARGIADPAVIGLFAVCVVAVVLFVRHCRRAPEPVISLEVFKYRGYRMMLPFTMMVMLEGISLGTLLPYYAQFVRGSTESIAGFLILPGTSLAAIGSPVAGRILDKRGAVRPMTFGAVMGMCGLAFFVLLSGRLTTALTICVYFVYAFFSACCSGNAVTMSLAFLPDRLKTHGNAVNNTMRQLSAAVGTCVVTSIVAQTQAAIPDDFAYATMLGTRYAFVVLLCVMIAMVALIIAFGRRFGPITPVQAEELAQATTPEGDKKKTSS